MTDPRIEAAARSIWMDMQDAGTEITFENASTVNRAMALSLARNALAAADAAAWRPIAEYNLMMGQVYCGHSEKKWLRHGRMLPGHGSRWYYSGTNERSQWAEQEGDKPTHFRLLPAPPASIDALGGVDG